MRRASSLLAFAALLITIVVGVTYTVRRSEALHRRIDLPPSLKTTEDGLALQGWKYNKDDPETNKPVVRLYADSFRVTNNPSAFELQGLALKQFNKKDASYTYIKASKAHFDQRSEVMTSEGPVSIVMNVPVDKDAEDKAEVAKRVQVHTSGVMYNTKSFKAQTDQPATFIFPNGTGKCVGVEYDPQTKLLHMKSQVVLDRDGMHIEAGDLIYNEAEQKIYLSPWSKLKRQTLNIQAKNSIVTLSDDKDHRGKVQQIDSEFPVGADNRKGRQVEYSADHMTAHFDNDGNMTEVTGDHNAHVVSTQELAKTVISGDKADLHFALESKAGKDKPDSYLQSVVAEGHAVAESSPVEKAGVTPTETRILRSETIQLEMKPGGQEVQEIDTPAKAQLEFKPNRLDQVHRVLDASKMRIIYGAHSYVDTFMGWGVTTRTDKPPTPGEKKKPEPAFTWSDEMTAKFVPNSSTVDHIEQRGNFRYKEGDRQASANKAVLEQEINRITLIDHAKVSDNTGSTQGDLIVMDQVSGDMDVTGKVLSVRAPDKSQKPGTSMLDQTQPLQARADKMRSRDNNYEMFYEGNVVMWQGADRISADKIEINRDDQTLIADGHVMSELVDNKKAPAPANDSASSIPVPAPPPVSNPVYTTVEAPHLIYHDDTRVALYSGGVTLLRNAMTIHSDELRAFLTPKTADNSGDSSLDHAFADGAMVVSDTLGPNHTRKGSANHGEYYTKEDKVILTGGTPQIVDNIRGITKGKEITYYSGEDRLLVQGSLQRPAFSRMIKK
jgi:lipopolysaccharide export system protein LptA